MPAITKVETRSLGSRPVLVEFQNGKVLPKKHHQLEGNVYKSQDDKIIVGVTSPNMLYTGELQEEEYYNNFFLIHDKNTDEIKLVQFDTCMVYPRLDKQSPMKGKVSVTDSSSVAELGKQFGSKKTKRNVEQRERHAMNIDAVKEQLEETVSGIKLDSSQLDSAVNEDHSIYRPKINRDASTRDGVYNLDDLVPSHILAALENDASNIINLGGVDLGQSQFVSSSIQKVLTSGIPQELMIRKLTIFLYIHYLMKFMGTPMKHVTKRFVVCDRSADVNNHILDNFSVMGPNGRTRPVHMKDKSLCFIVVLAAIALDYEVDLASLSKDCKIGVKKALEISRILAFNASAKNKTVVTLKLPLPAPVTFTPKRRRK